MQLLDLVFVFWLVAGTFAIKAMIRGMRRGQSSHVLLLAVGLPLSFLPLLALKLELFKHSALSVVAATIILFWFCILLSRAGNEA